MTRTGREIAFEPIGEVELRDGPEGTYAERTAAELRLHRGGRADIHGGGILGETGLSDRPGVFEGGSPAEHEQLGSPLRIPELPLEETLESSPVVGIISYDVVSLPHIGRVPAQQVLPGRPGVLQSRSLLLLLLVTGGVNRRDLGAQGADDTLDVPDGVYILVVSFEDVVRQYRRGVRNPLPGVRILRIIVRIPLDAEPVLVLQPEGPSLAVVEIPLPRPHQIGEFILRVGLQMPAGAHLILNRKLRVHQDDHRAYFHQLSGEAGHRRQRNGRDADRGLHSHRDAERGGGGDRVPIAQQPLLSQILKLRDSGLITFIELEVVDLAFRAPW